MSYFALVPKEKALSKDYDPNKDNRADWLSLNQADKLICSHFGVEPDDKYYYKSWKDFLYYSQSESSKGIIGCYGKFYIFKESENYIRLYCFQSVVTTDTKQEISELAAELIVTHKELIDNKRKEMLDVIYNAGYVLIGVFNED